MTDQRIIEYKKGLKSPYTGMVQSLFEKLAGKEPVNAKDGLMIKKNRGVTHG